MFLAIQSGMQVHELLVLKLDQSINNKMLNNEMLLSNIKGSIYRQYGEQK